jgi:hypothetical protein
VRPPNGDDQADDQPTQAAESEDKSTLPVRNIWRERNAAAQER